MKFYTSVLPYRGRLLVRGVNHDGSHKKYRINYKPSLFVPSNNKVWGRVVQNVAQQIKFRSEPKGVGRGGKGGRAQFP